MTKTQLLDQEAVRIAKCRICKIGKVGKAVPGEGNPNAKIVFIGEAPGRTESQTGRPFIGRSGQYLTKLIESAGLVRDYVYITSPVKYFPIINPGEHLKGRAPTDVEIAHGKIHLNRQLAIINPKLIILLGSVAAKTLLNEPPKVSRTHGKVIVENGISYFITYHPAAAIRFTKIRKLIEADFQKLLIYGNMAKIMPPAKRTTK